MIELDFSRKTFPDVFFVDAILKSRQLQTFWGRWDTFEIGLEIKQEVSAIS